MKYSMNALATLMATLTGSVVAVGTTKCPSAACSQTTVDARAVCGWQHPQTALLASSFTHFGVSEEDEAGFFEIPAASDEFRYEDSCGRDPVTGEIFGYAIPELAASVNASQGATKEIVFEHLSTLGTCELTLSDNPTGEQHCPINTQGEVAQHATREDVEVTFEEYNEYDYYSESYADDASAYESAEPTTNDEEEAATEIEVNLNSQLQWHSAQESLVNLWLQIKPLWSNAGEELSAKRQRAEWIAKRTVASIPIIVLREDTAADDKIAEDYAAAEWEAAQQALTPEEIATATEQAAEVYSRILPAAPQPNELSYEEEYQRNYELIPLAAGEDASAPAVEFAPEVEATETENNDLGDDDFENNDLGENAYEYDVYENAEAALDPNVVEQTDLENQAPSGAVRKLWESFDELWGEWQEEAAAWQEDMQELLSLGDAVVDSSRHVYRYAQELAWEQETQTLDQLFNEYCSLVEFDNLVMGIKHRAETNLQSQLVQGLRTTGNFLLECADQLDSQAGKRPYLSARPGEHR